MSNSAQSFVGVYVAAASSSEPIPVEMQEAILRYALKKGAAESEHLLTLMARRSDLSPKSEATLSKVSAAKVKAVWLSRPGLSAEEISILLKGEKRATVLASIASSAEASESLLSILATDARPTVAWAVFHNSKTTSEARAQVFLSLIESNTRHNYDDARKLRDFLTNNPDLHERALKVTKDPEMVKLCLPGLSAESYPEVAKSLVFAPYTEALTNSISYYKVMQFEAIGSVGLKIIEAAGSTDPTALEVALCLKNIINDPDMHMSNYNTVFTKDVREVIALLVGSDEEKAEAARLAKETLERHQAAATSEDPEILAELVELALLEFSKKNLSSYNITTQPISQHLIKNPKLPLSEAERMIRIISREDIAVLARTVAPSPSSLEEYSFLARIIEIESQHFDNFCAAVADKRAFLEVLIEEVFFNPHPQTPDYLTSAVMPRIIGADSSPEMIKKLPLSHFLNTNASLLVPLVNEAAEGNPKIWQNFEVLAKGFEGSVGDFLEVSSLLTE